MSQSEAGKGSRPRPFSLIQEEWTTRWDAIFGRDLIEDKEQNLEDLKEKNTEGD